MARQKDHARRWKPISLRTSFLLGVIGITISLIGTIQMLLQRSQQQGALVIADNVNELPLMRSFPYLYLPTILAVGYTFLWSWIDLDIKRLAPFDQLSSTTPVAAETSLLLQYPFDFIVAVPLKALRFRHGSVFVASIGVLTAAWGLTPAQSGIFTRSVNITQILDVPVSYSTNFTPVSEQKNFMPALYATSASNILWLNETLPPFMTREYVLAPFGPSGRTTAPSLSSGATLSGNTRMYSVNITCDPPASGSNCTSLSSSWGCSYSQLRLRFNHNNNATKIYDGLYVGDSIRYGGLREDLAGYCPENASDTFMIQFSKALVPGDEFSYMNWNEQCANANVTFLFCRPSYWQQDVYATVKFPENSVVRVDSIGPRLPLPSDMFNATVFEATVNVGQQPLLSRADFPDRYWPNQAPYLASLPLNVDPQAKMAYFAVSSYLRPIEDYLNPETLRLSYQAAYQLLLARQLVPFFSSQFDPRTQNSGKATVQTQGIITVPAFAYATEAILGATICFAIILLYLEMRKSTPLKSDPSTISSLMSLVADEEALLDAFKSLDRVSKKDLIQVVSQQNFQLKTSSKGSGNIISLSEVQQHRTMDSSAMVMPLQRQYSDDFLWGIRPFELGMGVGILILTSLILVITAVIVFQFEILSQNGLPLPSDSLFVRRLVETYIPTALATSIGPFWQLLNRLLGMFQPFEALKHGVMPAAVTLDLGYTTLPPQFSLIPALRNKHFLLAGVSAMTIIADILPIAASGLFYESIVRTTESVIFKRSYYLRFQNIGNQTLIPDDTIPGPGVITQRNLSPIYMAMSNLTAGTPMPPWTDDRFVYMPFVPPNEQQNSSWLYRATTSALGANLSCAPLDEFQGQFLFDPAGKVVNLTATISINNATSIRCIAIEDMEDDNFANINELQGFSSGLAALEVNGPLDGEDPNVDGADICRDHFFAAWVRANTSQLAIPTDDTMYDDDPLTITSKQQTVMVCRPQLVVGTAEIVVNSQGYLQQVLFVNISNDKADNLFPGNSSNLLFQTNLIALDAGATWHSDAFPSDFNNYLIEKRLNSTKFIDSTLPPPSYGEAASAFSALYAKLFAITIGTNMEALFVPASTNETVSGFSMKPTIRIFISKPMLIISETILGLYLIMVITVYIGRPWKILPRLPTSPASVIAFFAASHAIDDFRHTSHMSSAERERHLTRLGNKYGFGSFIGTDGEPHVGIEKGPYVVPLEKARNEVGFAANGRKWKVRGGNGRALRKGFGLSSGDVKEGGWV